MKTPMADDDDHDLRLHFKDLKSAVQARTPPFPTLSMAAATPRRLIWWPGALAAAAAVVAAAYLISPTPQRQAMTLEPLFQSGEGGGFLASATSSSQWPSDALRPSHFNLIIP